ncbi:hypothetical protein [Massilia suwonensis]|uniref:HAF family extracellular repeat protein n=1 Tax=Massilia suwonensis TaxID=648895 RepID=A0ABW0MV01_9BURK
MFGSRSGKSSHLSSLIPSAAAFALATLLSACGGGGGGGHPPAPPQPGNPVPPPPPAPPVDLGPLYDFTELGLPGISFGSVERQGIANGGLVAGTSVDAAGVSHAFFYDGTANIDLGSFGGNASSAQAINRCGQVTGWAATGSDGIRHAFLYNGSLHDLSAPGDAPSWGSAITTCGKVAGWAVTPAGELHAFYYDGKTMRDLGTFGGEASAATDMNAVGQVVGVASIPGNTALHAFLYDARTGAPIQDIGVPGLGSAAIDINEVGQVAVSTNNADNVRRAFRYDAGTGTRLDLGLLPGSQGSEPRAINDAGHVVGYVDYADEHRIAFLHDGTTLRSLGTLKDGRASEAYAINAGGLVVGSAQGMAGQRAVAWGPGYGPVDLNQRVKDLPAGIRLVAALAVADDGAIAVRTNSGLGLLRPRK